MQVQNHNCLNLKMATKNQLASSTAKTFRVTRPQISQTFISQKLDQMVENCFVISNIYKCQPFQWNTKNKCLDELSTKNIAKINKKFNVSLSCAAVITLQTLLYWSNLDLAMKMFSANAYISVFLGITCGFTTLKYKKQIILLTNAIQYYNKTYSTNQKLPYTEYEKLKLINFLQNSMLSCIIMPTLLHFAIFIYPCMPSFAGNFLLKECGNKSIYNHVPNYFNILVKVLITLYSLQGWVLISSAITMHLCLVIYHGYIFSFYLITYCR